MFFVTPSRYVFFVGRNLLQDLHKQSKRTSTGGQHLRGDVGVGNVELCVQVQSEFKPKYGTKAKTAAAHAFDRQFGSRLKYHMEYCINNPGEISKIHRVKAKVDEVKGIMVQNIEKARLATVFVNATNSNIYDKYADLTLDS